MQFDKSAAYENMLRKYTFNNRQIFVQKNSKKLKLGKFGTGDFVTTRITNHWKKKCIVTSGRFLATETKDGFYFFQGKHRVTQIDIDPGKCYGLGWVGH